MSKNLNKMKAKFIILIVLFASVFVGCKDEKSSKVGTDEKPKTEEGFNITFNAIVEKDDEFKLFYNEDGSEAYDGEQMVVLKIVGKSEAQDLSFSLPEDATPMNLRFDIGGNKDLKKVEFNNFKIKHNKKTFIAEKANFFKYFYPNSQVEVDSINAVAKIIAKPSDVYNPIIGGTGHLIGEITKLNESK